MSLAQLLTLFVAGFLTDVIWALYIRKIANKNKLQGALYSVGTGICAIIFVEGLLTNIYLMIPWLIGLFFGSYFSDNIEQVLIKFFKGKI